MSLADSESLWVLNPSGQRGSGEFVDDTLQRRAEEQGLTARLDLAGDFPRQRVEVIRNADGWALANELFYRRGWTDGLPIVPPTLNRVAAMVKMLGRGRDTVLGQLDPLGGLATIEKVAANAVMAGCAVAHFPVVVAAVEGIVDTDFYLNGIQTTDENVTPLMIVNGPMVQSLQLNGSFGALGPGWQANACIGRALRLVMHNIGGGWPAAVSFAGLGQPGRYTLCLAENEAQSPWAPLHVEHGFNASDSVVTLLRAESAINVTGGLEELASVMGSSASAFSVMYGGRVGVVVAPFTAQECAKRGMSKDDVKSYLHTHGRIPVAQWERSWSYTVKTDFDWPDWILAARESGMIPVVASPGDITLIVAGGNVPIAQQAYFPTWGFPPARIMRRIQP